MKDSTKISVMKLMLWSETCLLGKIAALVFGGSVEIAPQSKQKVCLFCQELEAIHDFILRGMFVLSQAIVLSELTDNVMSIYICFCNQTWFQNPSHL